MHIPHVDELLTGEQAIEVADPKRACGSGSLHLGRRILVSPSDTARFWFDDSHGIHILREALYKYVVVSVPYRIECANILVVQHTIP